MNNKIITIIGIALVLAVGILWFSGKDNQEVVNVDVLEKNEEVSNNDSEKIDENNWKIYNNEGWDYSIKYPSELYIKDNPQGDKFPGDESTSRDGGQTLIMSDLEKMGIQDVMPDEKIHITITTSKVDSTFKKSQAIGDYFESGDKSISKIKIGELDAFEIKPELGQNNFISIYIIKNGWVYHLHGINYVDKELDSDNFILMRKIIDTFEVA